MKFNNKPNTEHNIDGKVVWESRSVSVVCVIIVYKNDTPYILASKRGQVMPNYQGKWNLVTGYLDWNESGTEAVYRECWEETGFDLSKYMNEFKVESNDLDNPWFVNTDPHNILQNVTLRYGVVLSTNNNLPELSTDHNEIFGESEDPTWIKICDIDDYDWAFNHRSIIETYYFLNKLK